jgi:5'-3' exonuclease
MSLLPSIANHDVVISADSDMLAYASTSTLWRPMSRDQFLVYKLSDVLRELGLSRAQLTALAIVSSNDYNKNIYSLGPATNYSIIKTLPGQGNA